MRRPAKIAISNIIIATCFGLLLLIGIYVSAQISEQAAVNKQLLENLKADIENDHRRQDRFDQCLVNLFTNGRSGSSLGVENCSLDNGDSIGTDNPSTTGATHTGNPVAEPRSQTAPAPEPTKPSPPPTQEPAQQSPPQPAPQEPTSIIPLKESCTINVIGVCI